MPSAEIRSAVTGTHCVDNDLRLSFRRGSEGGDGMHGVQHKEFRERVLLAGDVAFGGIVGLQDIRDLQLGGRDALVVRRGYKF